VITRQHKRFPMKIHRFSAFALLLAVSALTACSGNDEGQPSAVDSAVVDTTPETIELDTATAVDTGAEDTSTSTDSALDAADETSDAGDGATTETSDGATTCKSGAVQMEACGKCGSRSRLCKMGAWLEWGACLGETGLCALGETRDVACERCGTRKQTCTATCEWSSGACLDQKGCTAGSIESRTGLCLDPAKVQTRTCTETCSWSAWSDC
jgi:hypothetical protein